MTALPIVRRITALKDLGVFQNATAANSPEFRRLNLIYGFNGCGKTTLSRIFASLEQGAASPDLPQGGFFEIELTDGSKLSNTGSLSSLANRVLVFNEDFVEANLRWKEGTSNAIFFLGAQQFADARLLETKEQALDGTIARLTEARKVSRRADAAVAEHKRTTARLISEQLGLGRRYEAPDLAADYAAGTYSDARPRSEGDLAILRQTISEGEPLPKVSVVGTLSFDLASLMGNTRRVLQTRLGSLVIAELHTHAEMIEWVKKGRDYHASHDLSSCLFCGSALTTDRMQLLGVALGEKVETLLRETTSTFENVKEAQRECIRFSESFQSQNDLYAALREQYTACVIALRQVLNEGVRCYGEAIAPLSEKVTNPNADITLALIGDEAARQWKERVDSAVGKLNAVISEHNSRCDDFAAVQLGAREDLKAHYLSLERAKYDELSQVSVLAEKQVTFLEEQEKALGPEIENLKRLVRRHGPAAAAFNSLLSSYLGRNEIELVPTQEAFQIYRGGQPLKGPLSEGEKTALALCYFLISLKGEGRKSGDLIVVVDDPISSLDTRALHYAFNILRTSLQGAGQLIILTHNLHFMNEVKKWLKGLLMRFEDNNGGGGTPAALLFIDTIQAADAKRSSSLIEMPKLIRDHESEYHYLFFLVLSFAKSFNTFAEYFYLMPNALRKLMDIFFAFKVPGPHGLASKVNTLAKDRDLDANMLRSIDRLVQLESHADSLDDLVSLSSLTLEETRAAATALLSFIQEVEPEHYKQMERLCRFIDPK